VKSNLEAVKEMELNYYKLFKSELGQIVLADMKLSLGHGKTLYHEKQPNTDLYFHLGRQSVINHIVNLLETQE
jgi:hypothetical protein